MKSFLKWAGGKYRLSATITQLLPEGERLVEPFVGSGAVFLNSSYASYHLTDANPDLISLYLVLQEEGEAFISYAETFFTEEHNTADVYYHLRDTFNATEDRRLKSALFLYLNRHSFNGLCRYNSKGGYNVPFGRYKKPYFPRKEMIYFHEKSQHATFACCDYRETFASLKPGDVVYADPPYDALTTESQTFQYTKNLFTDRDQEELASLAEQAANQGVATLISNHHTPLTERLYAQAESSFVDVRRRIGAKEETRIEVKEVLALFRT